MRNPDYRRSVSPDKPTEKPSGPAPEPLGGAPDTTRETGRDSRVRGQLRRMSDHDLAEVLALQAELEESTGGNPLTLREAARRLRRSNTETPHSDA